MPNHPELGFPITTSLDNNFFVHYDKNALQAILDDLLSPEVYDENAWTSDSGSERQYIALNITQDNSGEIKDQTHIEFRRSQAQAFIGALNQFADDNADGSYSPLRAQWIEDWSLYNVPLKNAIVFNGFTSKAELVKKVKEVFPCPPKTVITNPQEILDILNVAHEGLMGYGENATVLCWDIEPTSALHAFLSQPAAIDRFNDAIAALGLDFMADDGEDSSQLDLSFPIIFLTRRSAYEAHIAQVKAELQEMVSQGWGLYSPACVLDADYYDSPYDDESTFREYFEEILDEEVFSYDAWSTDATGEFLTLNISLGQSGPITNPRQLAVRRNEIQKLMDSLEIYQRENDMPEPWFGCKWSDENKKTVVFDGINGNTKQSLMDTISSLFPRPAKSTVENPIEILGFILALDDGLEPAAEHPLSPIRAIAPHSTLYRLASDSNAVDRFNDAVDAWGLNFHIDDINECDEENPLEISLPVIEQLRNKTYQARLAEMKKELAEMALQRNETNEEVSAEDTFPRTTILPTPSTATQFMSVGQYKQHLKENQAFHFFGVDTELPEVDNLQTTFRPQ